MKDMMKPEWTPENSGEEFACTVMPGVEKTDAHTVNIKHTVIRKARQLTVDEYVEGILTHNRTLFARAITLVESNSVHHIEQAQEVIKKILPHTGKSIRIGITGVPGAGKSTFIESFGLFLIELGFKVAVLAIDPSSTISKGSVLGDKTRMEELSRREEAFIRPSPSSGTLGGVTRKTRETILLCEAAGFDVILVETVGVGQNEVSVRSMVDFFLLILISGAGDELQGIKKGVIEIADAILVNKADGDNIIKAKAAAAEYNMALHYLAESTAGWKTHAFTCSAREKLGINEIWKVIKKFESITLTNGYFEERRQMQMIEWLHSMLEEHILNEFFNHTAVKNCLPHITSEILNGKLPPTAAVHKVLETYNKFKSGQ
ncbi:MAG TPA: methylmalonyl Co-A mutase-associated GTPase MeaB [Candidatus Cloacimonadota bacterium]|jgi:LAO/AO transport system kinase|nr:methylmalonyl Co-A mutase-associated GTPase MeaB [Candidatus Cloacimonadota bacterium]